MMDENELYNKFADLYDEIYEAIDDEYKSKLEDLYCIMYEMKK